MNATQGPSPQANPSFDADRAEPPEARSEARSPVGWTHWMCSACSAGYAGTPEPSLDPRWGIARCPACHQRVPMANSPEGVPEHIPRSTKASHTRSARSTPRGRRP
jgi:hypothetical protein